MISSKLNRRRFLRNTIQASAGAAVAPIFVPARVLGRQGWISPNEQVRMGFIGVGTQGGGHLLGGAWTYVAGGYASRKDVRVLAICDVWKDRRERAQQKVNAHYEEVYGKNGYKACEAYNDFRQVLEDRKSVV